MIPMQALMIPGLTWLVLLLTLMIPGAATMIP